MTDARTKSNRAKTELLAYGDATADVRMALIEQWLATDISDTERREHIWRSVKALDNVLVSLNAAASSGALLDRKEAVKHILNPGDN